MVAISALTCGAACSGRIATRSVAMPSSAPIGTAKTRTTVSGSPVFASRPKQMKVLNIAISPWAKFDDVGSFVDEDEGKREQRIDAAQREPGCDELGNHRSALFTTALSPARPSNSVA